MPKMDRLSLVCWMHAAKHQKKGREKMKLHCINKTQGKEKENCACGNRREKT